MTVVVYPFLNGIKATKQQQQNENTLSYSKWWYRIQTALHVFVQPAGRWTAGTPAAALRLGEYLGHNQRQDSSWSGSLTWSIISNGLVRVGSPPTTSVVAQPCGPLAGLDDVRQSAPRLPHLADRLSVDTTRHPQAVEPLELPGHGRMNTWRMISHLV